MVKQLKIRLPNKPGTLEKVVGSLADAGVDIKALEVNDRGGDGSGEALLIVNDVDKATKALRDAGHEHEVEPVVLAELADEVGGLDRVLRVLAEHDVNISHLYAFVTRVQGKALAVFGVADPEKTIQLLTDAGCRVISQKALDVANAPPERTEGLEDHLGVDFIW